MMTFAKKYIHAVLFFIAILLIGCSASYDYTEEEPFVIASSPAGPDDYRNLISEQIAIEQDGTTTISRATTDVTDEPILKVQLTQDEVNEIKEKIEEYQFKKIPNDVSTPSEDGAKYTIQVHFSDDVKEVTGWNPSNENFKKLHTYLFSFINDEEYATWRREIEEYIWQPHSLLEDDKEAYNEKKPFFTFNLQQNITT